MKLTKDQDQDIKDHDINKNKGIALLKMLNLDEDTFCNVFNNFGKTAQKKKNLKHSGVKKVKKNVLENFVKSAMGSNYWMIHATDNSSHQVNMYYMDPTDVEGSYSKVASGVPATLCETCSLVSALLSFIPTLPALVIRTRSALAPLSLVEITKSAALLLLF